MRSFLTERLDAYIAGDRLRLHMPGHGGRLMAYDVTELSETDDLMNPVEDGAIEHDERQAAKLFSSQYTLFSAGGATLCLQTAIAYQLMCLGKGARVFCERGVHRSILHALALLDVDCCFVPSAEALTDQQWEEADLLIFSGCDYFGHIPDYAVLRALCLRHGVRTVVDNAHGTHLRFLADGYLHPLKYGFDLIVDSAHKTLPALTGAALLHIGCDLPEGEAARGELRHAMRLFSTTSPSFLILQSLSAALQRVGKDRDGQGHRVFDGLSERIRSLCEELGLRRFGRDPMRLSLVGGFDFPAARKHLAEKRITPELVQKDAMVMLFGYDTTVSEFSVLKAALAECLLPRACPEKTRMPETGFSFGERVMTLRAALFAPGETVEKSAAANRVAAEVIGNYPPGTALCLPGEIIQTEVLDRITDTYVRVVKEGENR